MGDLGPGNVSRHRVSVEDAARQGGAAFEKVERLVVSNGSVEETTSIRLGFCGSCGLAFHNDAEVAGKCYFCPSVLCATCAATRCQSCGRISCSRCVWRMGDSTFCRRHLIVRTGGLALVSLPVLAVVGVFVYLFVSYLGGL